MSRGTAHVDSCTRAVDVMRFMIILDQLNRNFGRGGSTLNRTIRNTGSKLILESRLANMAQEDIPGARAASIIPEKMTVADLKAWLMQKGASTKGKKSELLARSV